MVSLKNVLEIPSCSNMEDLVIEFIINFCISNNLQYEVDDHQNVYVTKGQLSENEYYPCVVAHTDTVHYDQKMMIKNREKIKIIEHTGTNGKLILQGWDKKANRPTGIGGDDKAGVYLCLKMLLEFDVIKAAFFTGEEIGMTGSKHADHTFFKNVGYAIQFDGPTRNWFTETLRSENIYNKEFLTEIQPLLDVYEVTNFSADPYTDVYQLMKKFDFCCANLPTGYYDWHTAEEYVVPEETEECFQLGKESVQKLGLKKYKLKN